MYFGKRWVPLEVMDTLVLLWIIMVVVFSALVLYLRFRRPKKKIEENVLIESRSRQKRKKRKP
jgi:uncharacterized membrane protein affecting hemolysin expression